MSEWKEYRLGDICKTNKSQYSIKENWHHFRYLDTGNITKGKIDEIQEFDSFDSLPSRARRKVVDGDIIYSSVRPNQEHYGYISNPPANLLVSTGFVVISVNTDIVNPVFLYNYLTRPEITKYLQAIGEQSVCTYPAIKPSDIEDLVIKMPSLDIQAKIASILSSLDEKIATNRRICENLEAQAQALFKHWFIDFAPFKDGKFVESELGMIPEGWSAAPLGELFNFQRGVGLTKNDVSSNRDKECAYVVYGAGKDIFGYSPKYMLDTPSVLIAAIGSSAGTVSRSYESKYSVTSNAFYVLPRKEYEYSYEVFSLQRYNFRNRCSGSAQPMLTYSSFANDKILYPTSVVIQDFNDLCLPILEKINLLYKQSRTLEVLRNTLLPKLMSGQIQL